MKKKTIPKAIKIQVWNKYIGEEIGKHLCLCCNTRYITQASFHCGHFIAEANGGLTTVDNMRPICELCNKSMGTKNMGEFINNMVNNKPLETKPTIEKNTRKKSVGKKQQQKKITSLKDYCLLM